MDYVKYDPNEPGCTKKEMSGLDMPPKEVAVEMSEKNFNDVEIEEHGIIENKSIPSDSCILKLEDEIHNLEREIIQLQKELDPNLDVPLDLIGVEPFQPDHEQVNIALDLIGVKPFQPDDEQVNVPLDLNRVEPFQTDYEQVNISLNLIGVEPFQPGDEQVNVPLDLNRFEPFQPVRIPFIYYSEGDPAPWIRTRTRSRMITSQPRQIEFINALENIEGDLMPPHEEFIPPLEEPIPEPQHIRRIVHITRHANPMLQALRRAAPVPRVAPQPIPAPRAAPAPRQAILIPSRNLRLTSRQRIAKVMQKFATA